MSFVKIKITNSALEKLRAFVRTAGKFEIGGPMVGFMAEDGMIVVDLEGPGKKGKCAAFTVTIDGDHSKEFCDAAFRESRGLLDYVGDWHCHPSICLRPSQGDHQAMEILADSPGLTSNPISLIYGSIFGRFKIYKWDDLRRRLVVISHKVIDQVDAERMIAGSLDKLNEAP